MTYQEVVLLVVDFMKNNNLEEKEYMPADTDLIHAVGKYLGFTNGKYIKVVPIDTSNKLILGKLRHFKDHVDIGINDFALNTCWRRFVITKELSHLIMSRTGEGITEDMETLINGLFQMNFGLSDDIDHESFALMMALEYLMPYNISQSMLKDSNIDDIEIAKRFGVPELVVKSVRTDFHMRERDEVYSVAFENHEVIT